MWKQQKIKLKYNVASWIQTDSFKGRIWNISISKCPKTIRPLLQIIVVEFYTNYAACFQQCSNPYKSTVLFKVTSRCVSLGRLPIIYVKPSGCFNFRKMPDGNCRFAKLVHNLHALREVSGLGSRWPLRSFMGQLLPSKYDHCFRKFKKLSVRRSWQTSLLLNC